MALAIIAPTWRAWKFGTRISRTALATFLDLTRVQIPEGRHAARVRAWLGFGDLTVILPRELAVRVQASAGLGEVSVLGRKHEGIGPTAEVQSEDYATAPRQLDLEASVGLGEVKVVRGD